VTVGDRVWTGSYSGSCRFHDVLPGFEAGEGTNPEELLAAAHAACFTMALTETGAEPGRLRTQARVHLRFLDGAPTIRQIDLETEGDVRGIDEAGFRERAEEAKRFCIVSRALGGLEQIDLLTRLLGGGDA
jgi:lipoyl-dependent peroxiredoxin